MASSELPGNSHRRQAVPTNEPAKKSEKPEKKLEKVVTSPVMRQKKPLHQRFGETFIGSHAKDAWQFVLLDVLVPAAKNMIAQSVSQGVERMVYGSALPYDPRDRRRDDRMVRHTSYDRITDRSRLPREEPRLTNRGIHDFDDIVLGSRAEAEMVIQRLYELVDIYEQATVADLYELVGETGSFTDERYGWTDMRGADARPTRGGYYRLILPRTEPLK